MPPPSSAEPRPYRRVPTSVATNGSVSHADESGTGCTSWCAYSSTVGACGSTIFEPMTSHAPGVPSGLRDWTTFASMPTWRSSSATNSADRFICSAVMPSAEIDFSATLRPSRSTTRPKSASTRARSSSENTAVMMLLTVAFVIIHPACTNRPAWNRWSYQLPL